MLDIGFAELLVISAVALFVVGPDRLPSAIRSISLWLGRVRRGFEEIKSDVSRELHNEEVMRALKESRDEVQDLTDVSSALSLTENSKKSGASLPENSADSNTSESESNTPLSSQTGADDPAAEVAAVESPAEVESTLEKGA
ncbi:MAG: Sec-independent protein translocase protein TatB [Luminiphilus sp.]|jgi:sec-independent protein translocase protein TatB|tara:strand:+ start:175 stop:600 length:426 start_codon:yes stop_codon:yes gene_type:complete